MKTARIKTRNSRATKDALFGQVARISRALANPKRLELLALLAQAPRAVEDLAAETAVSLKLASAHLKELRLARLVDTQREGKRIVYRSASPEVGRAWVMLRELAEGRLPELQAAMRQLGDAGGEWRSEQRSEFLRKVRKGDIVLLDVRPAAEFEYGHLPHARSLPHDELASRLHELPRNRPIVAYCRGPFCLFAADAVRLLQAKGFDAKRLGGGVLEWKAGRAAA